MSWACLPLTGVQACNLDVVLKNSQRAGGNWRREHETQCSVFVLYITLLYCCRSSSREELGDELLFFVYRKSLD